MIKVKDITLKLFTTAIFLLSVLCFAYGQSTENLGHNPYVNSTHAYRVKVGDPINNTQLWQIKVGATTYNLPVAGWSTISTAGGYSIVEITFLSSVFGPDASLPLNDTLRYTETDKDNNCVSARIFPITVLPNTFYLEVSATDFTTCNSESDSINSYDDLKDATDRFSTAVTYTITMHKANGFDPTSWDFHVHFDQALVGGNITSSTSTYGAVTIVEFPEGPDNTDYNINVSHPTGDNPSSVTVTLTVSYSNTVLADVTRNMTVSNGRALVTNPPAPVALTIDNTTTYIDGDPNRTQAAIIYSIPATQNITFGEGETAASASHPLQNSRHRYTVQMGAVANLANSTPDWYITTSAGVAVDAGLYTITQGSSPTNDTATIVLDMGPGDYILSFVEENNNGCSTIRQYPFEVGEPFDVDIVEVADACPTVSGQINNTIATATTTVVTYTVNLNTSSYGSDWSFRFSLTSSPGFGADMNVAAATDVVVAGGTYTQKDNYLGDVEVQSTENKVTITVTYTGFYDVAHDVTATISNIEGSYHEVDADFTTGTGNSTTHRINRVPQTGELAGVE